MEKAPIWFTSHMPAVGKMERAGQGRTELCLPGSSSALAVTGGERKILLSWLTAGFSLAHRDAGPEQIGRTAAAHLGHLHKHEGSRDGLTGPAGRVSTLSPPLEMSDNEEP